MWIQNVRALGFGALEDGASLDFSPGMNVVYGVNEAGKSTWQTALMVAICGYRKKAGRAGADRRAIERYQPWGGGNWGVAADIWCGSDGYRIHRNLHTGNCTISDL